MSFTLLTDIPFQIDTDQLLTRMHMAADSPFADDIRLLATQAEKIGRPKAIYRVARIESKSDDTLIVDGVTFTSRVLRVNCDAVHRVFPFVATCGTELAEWGESQSDPLLNYAADAIQEMALTSGAAMAFADMADRYQTGKLGLMNPGSLADWPLPEQSGLFRILGDVEGQVGVHLTPNFLMIPAKSLSGVRFPTESSYENCELCTASACPGRRAPYDATLYDRKYRKREEAG